LVSTIDANVAAPKTAPPIVHEVLGAPGRPLETEIRAAMEPRFGVDFSRVRIHADPKAATSANSVAARAFTVGHQIVFGPGEYRPWIADGQRLLVHELAHVAQQTWAQSAHPVLQRDEEPPTKAEARSRGQEAGKLAEQQEDPKIARLKAELMVDPGFLAVTEQKPALWTAAELEKMKRLLKRIPADEKAAARRVELRRVVSTTESGDIASGLFLQRIDPATAIRQDRIEIADDAFAADVDFDTGEERTMFGGEVVQGAPSEGVLAHEVGHAVESVDRRRAETARVAADISAGKTFETLDAAIKAYNAVVPTSIEVPAWNNAKEKSYQTAIISAHEKLGAITAALNTIPQDPTSTDFKNGAVKVKAAVGPAEAAIAHRNAARKALPAGSSYAMPTEEAAQDAWLAAAAALIPTLEAHAKAEMLAERARTAADATEITVTVASHEKIKMTRRLAEFVAIIEANHIDIVNAGLGEYVSSRWPNKPEEAYAELYSFSITAPNGLRKFDKNGAVATYFASPVGLKGHQKAQVAAWLAKHQ
jgi:hypothetical protein